jgi:uncharacterized membrane protein
MKLTFDQWMRLLLLVSGIAFFGVGVWMVKTGIKAEGSIDIRSTLLSGSLKTGSAGLFITFMSFFMILASVLFSKWPARPRDRSSEASASGMRTILRILFTLYALTIIAYLLARSASGGEQIFFGFVTAALIILSVIFSFLTFFGWLEEEAAKEKEAAQKVSKT